MKSTDLEKLVALLVESRPAQRAARRGDGGADEVIALIEAQFSHAPVCRHCNAREVQKWGRASGLKRYRCKGCGKTFNALTGSPLARLRHRKTWAAFGAALAEGLSIRKAAMRCGINVTTSFRWRHRFLQKQKPDGATDGGSKRMASSNPGTAAVESLVLMSSRRLRKPNRKPQKRSSKGKKPGRSNE